MPLLICLIPLQITIIAHCRLYSVSIADQFPVSYKKEYSRRALAVGSVIRCMVDDTVDQNGQNKPKEKFWIIVGFDRNRGELASVYVNTEIAKFILAKPDLLATQYLLEPDERALVDYDCHADCCQLKSKKTADIQKLLEANPEFVRGELNARELDDIMDLLRKTTNIAPILKKRFGILK